MKKSLFLVFLITCGIGKAISQNNNLIVFSEQGLRFTLILNGERQNASPATNVKVTGLNAANYKAKLIFENGQPDVDQTVYLLENGNPVSNSEISYALIQKKENYKLRWFSSAPIPQTQVITSGQTVVPFGQAMTVQTNPADYSGNGSTTTTTTVTSTDVNSGNPGMNMNIGINGNGTSGVSMSTNVSGTGMNGMPDQGMNVNVGVNGTGMNTNGGTYMSNGTTTYSTTTTTTTSSSNGMNMQTPPPAPSGYVLPGYNGTYGCPAPMMPGDFQTAKASISSKTFEDAKLKVAKQITESNCLLSSQIKEIMGLFEFEASKLDYAKFAWGHVLDKNNYYQLNDAFTFDASVSELDNYIHSH